MLDHFGNVVKDAIFIKNLNQKIIAEELRIAPQTLNAYLNSRRTPNIITSAQLMKILEIDANEALGLYEFQTKSCYCAFLNYHIQQLSIEQQKTIIDFLQLMQNPKRHKQTYIREIERLGVY